MLSTITSLVLSKITLSFDWDEERLEQVDWDGLDRLLSGARFPALSELTICCRWGFFFENELGLSKIVQLPRLRSRGGILRLKPL